MSFPRCAAGAKKVPQPVSIASVSSGLRNRRVTDATSSWRVSGRSDSSAPTASINVSTCFSVSTK
jgi:hypothetical protein